MELNRIKDLIKVVEESNITGLLIEEGSTKIEIKKYPEGQILPTVQQAIVPSAPAVMGVKSAEAENSHAGLTAIKSPMTGTFYSASSPDVPAYIKVGDKVSAGKPVCIIEAMKTFNEIESDIAGTIEKVMVNNGSPVEMGQPLFLVRE